MAAPATGAPLPSQRRERGGDLVVEWRGPHTLIRSRDEVPGAADVLGTIPWVPGSVLVLASASAHRHPGLFVAVRDWLSALRSTPGGAGLKAVWLAVPDLGNTGGTSVPWLHGLAVDFEVDVIAPHGGLTTVGAGMYVNRNEGGVGWRRFGPRGNGEVISSRFPVPAWEHQLPDGQLTVAGLVTETVPAGLAVRPAGLPALSHASPAFRAPLHPRIPKMVVGQPGVEVAAKAVAQLVGDLPEPIRRALLYVPVSPSAAAPEWAAELALLLGHDVMITAGLETMNSAGAIRTVVLGQHGEQVLVPLAALLRQRPGAAAPEVVGIASPPPGWEKHGPRSYRRLGDEHSSPLAEVLPGGLHVRAKGDQPMAPGRLDSRSWTLAVGGAGRQVTESELAAVRELLGGLTPHQCHTAEVRVLGTAAPDGLAALGAYVRSVGATLKHEPVPKLRAVPKPEADREPEAAPKSGAAPEHESGAVLKPEAENESGAVPKHERAPEAVATPLEAGAGEENASVPVPLAREPETEADLVRGAGESAGNGISSSNVARLGEPDITADAARGPGESVAEPAIPPAPIPPAPIPPATESGRPAPARPPVAVTSMPVSTVSGPTTAKPTLQPAPEPAVEPEPEPEQHEPEAEEAVAAAHPRPDKPVELADRPSTPAEQTRLATSAGAHYTEALAAVNVALSAWPMLKPDAKADYVAVCLYLGRGEGGAVSLAEALAEGREPFDAYLPCLVSGLRRLPTHRKVVLRQERVGKESPYAAGAVLCEPGFLSASAELDVTTASADLDQLIWPVSARRTSELMMGRTVDEVVFPVGRRFKALALRTHEPEDGIGPRAPRTALLTRELLPDEDPQSPQALERDRTVLPRLERAWQERQSAELRLVEEPDALARLTAPLMRAELTSAVGAAS
ncbi:hypothetical protein [Lentzea kentuckyensis]|uniref:hypothetical protein n=1 Tax=Lentzea kentuckyensis TaxID=360086 RepID=UPI00117ACCF9|nr:hypothetical protein [Lentzea kentuckyensis]